MRNIACGLKISGQGKETDKGNTDYGVIVLYCIVVGSRRLMPPMHCSLRPIVKPWSLVVPTFTARCLHQRP